MRLILASFGLLLGAGASQAVSSSFQRSCEDVQIEVVGGEVVLGNSSFQRSCDQYWLDVGNRSVMLNGNCRTRNGRYRESRIELQDIHNDDGRLVGN